MEKWKNGKKKKEKWKNGKMEKWKKENLSISISKNTNNIHT
jgi:hypothetical protein